MQFLTPSQWREWCISREIPLGEAGQIRPDISADGFHLVPIAYPEDSGKKVWLARRLHSLVAANAEALLLIDEWDIWPSSQHLPLFDRFREALGEKKSLAETPGHLVLPQDTDDAISIIAISLLFIWDCYGISSHGRDAFMISHDEHCHFASRDEDVAQRVESEFSTE